MIHWHIGLHKTGTTFIQANLARNASTLQTHGVALAPMHDAMGRHYAVVEAFRAGDFEGFFDAVVAHPSRRLIVSAEGLSSFLLDEGRARRLEAACRKYGVSSHFHLWLRRQDFLLESVFSQGVKESRDILDVYAREGAFDFASRVDLIERVFGGGRMSLHLYNDFERGDLLAEFCRDLGLDADEWSRTGAINVSPNRRETLLLSNLSERNIHRLARIYRDLKNSAAVADDGGRFFFAPDTRREIVMRHAAGNAGLISRFGIPAASWFAEPPELDADWTPPRPITVRERLRFWRASVAAERIRAGRRQMLRWALFLFWKLFLDYRSRQVWRPI
jgi:hypothetical protein